MVVWHDLSLQIASQVLVLTYGLGIVLCEPSARQYLINYSRPFIYSTSLPQFALTAIRASYNFLQTKKAEEVISTNPRKCIFSLLFAITFLKTYINFFL